MLPVDLRPVMRIAGDMANLQEPENIKLRSDVFAIITARLEDMHDAAITGQSENASAESIAHYVNDLESQLAEVATLVAVVRLLGS